MRKATKESAATRIHLSEDDSSGCMRIALTPLKPAEHFVKGNSIPQRLPGLRFALVHFFSFRQHIRGNVLRDRNHTVHIADNPVAGINSHILAQSAAEIEGHFEIDITITPRRFDRRRVAHENRPVWNHQKTRAVANPAIDYHAAGTILLALIAHHLTGQAAVAVRAPLHYPPPPRVHGALHSPHVQLWSARTL